MGFLDRFRTPKSQPEGPEVEPERWDGSGIDWAAAGVPADRVDMAVQLTSSPDFGVDPSQDPEWQWQIALYDDARGVVGDDAIEALPAWLEDQPGIDEALHSDRELIDVRATIDRDRLARLVVTRLATTGDPNYWDRDDGVET